MNRSEPNFDQTEFNLPKPRASISDRILRPVYSVLAAFNLMHPRAEAGMLYRRVRLAQLFLPPIIIAVVVSYQLYVVQLEMWSGAFWAEIAFYGILGPLVTFFVIGWIGVEVREREKAESDLRDLYLELSESHRRLAAIQIGRASCRERVCLAV